MTRLRNSYYPGFEAVVARKMEHQNLSEEDETQANSPQMVPTDGDFSTDHSSNDSTEKLSHKARQSAYVDAKDSPSDQGSSYSPTENMTRTSHSEDSCSLQLSHSGSRIDGEVSWSDSDGSTYVSESEIPTKDDLSLSDEESCEDNSLCAEKIPKTNDFEDIDLTDALGYKAPPRPKTSSKRVSIQTDPNHEHSSTKNVSKEVKSNAPPRVTEAQLLLKDIDIYQCFDSASTDEGISVTKFISSEETEDVFCRSVVPREIPVKKNQRKEDLSVLSSVHEGSLIHTGDTLSVEAVHTRRGTSSRRTRRNEKQIQTNKLITKVETAPAPLEFISMLPRSDSLSTLGNTSITTTEEDSDGVNGSHLQQHQYAKKAPPKESNRESALHLEVLVRGDDDKVVEEGRKSRLSRLEISEIGLNLPLHETRSVRSNRSKKESKTEERMRYLKERIRKMQVASTLETLPEWRKDEGRPSAVAQASVPAKKKLPTSQRKSQDAANRIKLQDVDYFRNVPVAAADTAISVTDLKMSTESASGAFDKVSVVPSQVTADDESDDISAMPCDLEEIDLEAGTHFEDSKKKKSRFGSNKVANQVSSTCAKTAGAVKSAARGTNDYLEQYAVYVRLQLILSSLWTKYMHGRSQTEKALVAVIFSSVLILFILLLAIIAG